MILNIYITGVIISTILLMVAQGYILAKNGSTESPAVLFFSAIFWPIMLPIFIGVWLGTEK